MNLALAGVVLLMGWIYGFGAFLFIQAVAWTVAGAGGIWLFYVQHQFEDVLGTWRELGLRRRGVAAAVPSTSCRASCSGSPGNIGFHHIHHLSPRIPNYHLQKCHEADPVFQQGRA